MPNQNPNSPLASALTVSVIGCGWLGFPLAQRLIQVGAKVHGSSTHPAKLKTLRDAGIEASLLRLEAESEATPPSMMETEGLKDLFASPQIVLNIPPSNALNPEEHIGQVRGLLRRIPTGSLQHFVFVSSISVYGDVSGDVDETTEPQPQSVTGEILRETERFLENTARERGFALSIVRAGGLMGFGRHPGKFLAGRKGVKDPNHPVNTVHQLDLIEALTELLRAPSPAPGSTRIFNAVASTHPSRKEFYTEAARRLELPPPEFAEADNSAGDSPDGSINHTNSEGRRISGEKLKTVTGVQFRFDDLMSLMENRKL